MEHFIQNWPIIVLLGMIVMLLITHRGGMITPTAIAALVVLLLSGENGAELLARIAPSIGTVLIVMGCCQLAVRLILQAGFGEHIASHIARLAAHRWFAHLPASILLPIIFVPASMLMAALLHNITAISVLTPLALLLCQIYRVNPMPVLSAMLIGSNLGGASAAWGDTPAILQRMLWGFSPYTFSAAMVPRNLIVLILLTTMTAFWCWLPHRKEQHSWLDVYQRLKASDDLKRARPYCADDKRLGLVGLAVLLAFLVAQFMFPKHAMVSGALCFATLLLYIPREKHTDALTVLGLDAILVIVSLFIVAGAVESTPLAHHIAELLKQHSTGTIEVIAYGLTSAISADGSAAMLAPIVHKVSNGGMLAAWQLAAGICAGSSMLLTSASAGPIINSISKENGNELTFRAYASFGIPFSLIMLVTYLILNIMMR